MCAIFELPLNSLNHGWRAMAKYKRGVSKPEVDVFVSVNIVKFASLRFCSVKGIRLKVSYPV